MAESSRLERSSHGSSLVPSITTSCGSSTTAKKGKPAPSALTPTRAPSAAHPDYYAH
jgi:hypothetical protein